MGFWSGESHNPVYRVGRGIIAQFERPGAYATWRGVAAAGVRAVLALGVAGAVPGLRLMSTVAVSPNVDCRVISTVLTQSVATAHASGRSGGIEA